MSSRYRYKCCNSNPVLQSTIPAYTPKCCPIPPNTDPRRTSPYKPPVISRSEPLSHAEYLRKKKEAGGGSVSGNILVQVGEGAKSVTLWTAVTTCCPSFQTVPPVAQTAIGEGQRTETLAHKASITAISKYTQTTRDASLITELRAGRAILSSEGCTTCDLSGTTIYPGKGCCEY
jgi:hypothetical protein